MGVAVPERGSGSVLKASIGASASLQWGHRRGCGPTLQVGGASRHGRGAVRSSELLPDARHTTCTMHVSVTWKAAAASLKV